VKKLAKVLLYVFGGLTAIAAATAIVLVSLDWNSLRSTVNETASAVVGRKVEIRGDLRAALSLKPELVARDVVIANAEWGSRPEMLTIEELHLKFRVLPLLAGRLHIDAIRLVRPNLLLERQGAKANWRFGGDEEAKERDKLPIVRRVSIEGGDLSYKSDLIEEPVDVHFDELDVETWSLDSPVGSTAKGTFKKLPFSVEATLGSLERLRDTKEPYPVKVSAQIGSGWVGMSGGVREPAILGGIEAWVEMQGKNLAEVQELFGMPAPLRQPYAIAGYLTMVADNWELRGLEGRLGSSDLRGDMKLITDGPRPRIVADLQSKALDVADIEGLLGEKSERGDSSVSPAGEGGAKNAPKPGGRILPDQPFKLPALRRIDADVRFRGNTVTSGTLEMRSLSWHLQLADGVLTLRPLELGLANGRIRVNFRLDGRKETPAAAADVRVEGMELNALLALLGIKNESFGLLYGNVQLRSQGQSPREIAARANGQGLLVMSGGKISNLLLELMALDLQEALGQWISGDKSMVGIDCMVMPFPIQNGKLIANPWLLDTTDTYVAIHGSVDLATETVALKLAPQPKDFSLFNTLTSIEIKGDLARRKVSVNPLEAAGKVVLKTLAAPLMPLLSPSIEETARAQSPCARMFAEMGIAKPGDAVAPTQSGPSDRWLERAAPVRPSPSPDTVDKRLVADVQRALNQRGAKLAVDGALGPNTLQALRRFQGDNALPTTGRLDRQTLERLGLDAGRTQAPRRNGPDS
jgi:uncharacterized protein involved in outer membrane biogenesis